MTLHASYWSRYVIQHVKTTAVVNRRFASKSSGHKRIFSGIQPTGIPHLGNYFGAIEPWVKFQNDANAERIYCVVDLHCLTVRPPRAEILRQNVLQLTACLLASGIDPEKCTLFQQSAVSQHSALSWIFGCLVASPRLQHFHQFKEKSAVNPDVSVGLYTYPVLQAADILLYKATAVPVGEDQLQHIELTRQIARKFNKFYEEDYFPEPKTLLGIVPRLRSLRDPLKKMSKSHSDVKSRIELLDSPDDIRKKIKKAVTDTTSFITYDQDNRPGISNLVEMYSAFSGHSVQKVVEDVADLDTLAFKTRLGDLAVESLAPVRRQALDLLQNEDYIWNVLQKGASRAQDMADTHMDEVKQIVGLKEKK